MAPDLDKIVFIDSEIGYNGGMAADIGAVKGGGAEFHSASAPDFAKFIRGCKYICGHNILEHDAKYLEKEIFGGTPSDSSAGHGAHGGVPGIGSARSQILVDTLFLSPLAFPRKPYHRLLKDDKLAPDELNNPLNDAKKARDLFFDIIAAFESMDGRLREVYAALLHSAPEFNGFFRYMGYKKPDRAAAGLVREAFKGEICEKAPVKELAEKSAGRARVRAQPNRRDKCEFRNPALGPAALSQGRKHYAPAAERQMQILRILRRVPGRG